MIIKRNMAVDSLTRVCEESLALIKQLIDADNEVYAKGVEDGMAAQADVQKTLRPWVGLTDEEVELYWDWEDFQTGAGRSTIFEMVRDIEAKLKEKNT
jgi:hypothetical protein